jgi:hypothetical protein
MHPPEARISHNFHLFLNAREREKVSQEQQKIFPGRLRCPLAQRGLEIVNAAGTN